MGNIKAKPERLMDRKISTNLRLSEMKTVKELRLLFLGTGMCFHLYFARNFIYSESFKALYINFQSGFLWSFLLLMKKLDLHFF